ncbi:MAG: class I SAM-dependent methyltransferase [Nocardioides sp.]|nr:class I SAM-dependent methyltransferase [Nocardioides sp.]
MTDQPAPDPALSFGSVAAAYDRGRPTYPREAIEWAIGTEPRSVLELGAGTGKLTQRLVEAGHEVFATDPDDAMLDVLSERLPDVRATRGTAEQIPTSDGLYDVVVTGQAFHWFDTAKALPEIVRVLRPGGGLVILRNERDERIPWVRRMSSLIGKSDKLDPPTKVLDDSGLFSAVDTGTFRHWQVIDRETVQDLVLSRSPVTVLDADAREQRRREVLAFYDDYGRGMDGMQLPYNCVAYRTQVLPHARPHDDRVEIEEKPADPPMYHRTDTVERLPRVITDPRHDDGGDDMLLIDFT